MDAERKLDSQQEDDMETQAERQQTATPAQDANVFTALAVDDGLAHCLKVSLDGERIVDTGVNAEGISLDGIAADDTQIGVQAAIAADVPIDLSTGLLDVGTGLLDMPVSDLGCLTDHA